MCGEMRSRRKETRYEDSNWGQSLYAIWSIAQTKNRETEPDGIGWELFENYLIARKKFRPSYFLYENNKSMDSSIRTQITRELGVEPILINSALVSAQNRMRLYWTNIPGVEQPKDLGIVLRDILENKEEAKAFPYTVPHNSDVIITESAVRCQRRDKKHSTVQGSHVNFTDRKSQTLSVAHTPKVFVPIEYNPLPSCNVMVSDQNIRCSYKNRVGTAQGYTVYFDDVKSPSVIAGHAHKMKVIVPATESEDPVYEVRDGKITIKGQRYPIKLADGYYIIRKLTVTECKRLQTVPDDYIFPVSNAQAYKMLGNGWTVDVIAHILHYISGVTDIPLETLSMYDGMSCGRLALNKLGARIDRYYATEIDKYAIKTTLHNFPDTIQLGDAFQVRNADWKLPERGGSL